VPPQNVSGVTIRGHLRQEAMSQPRAQNSLAPPFVVGQPQSSAVQLRFQHSILFAEVVDDVVLPVFEPADKSRENQLQRNHPVSLRQR
jgi:hypothetical protein